MKPLKIIANGIFSENPIFRLVLGMCPTLATSTALTNGIGMGLAATFVLTCSNVFISLLRNFIPNKVRIPAFIVVIASFTTIVQLCLKAYLPDLDKSLGLFIPLIVVNCIILARAESFASKQPVFSSFLDGIGIGLGFTIGLCILSFIREITGSGTLMNIKLFGDSFNPAMIMTMAPGGFLTLGLVLAFINFITSKREGGKS